MADAVEQLAELLCNMRVVALTGAGCSTESGIPDYRGEGTRQRARKPMTFQEYTRDPDARRRYWERSIVGWPLIRDARPNPAHFAFAALEREGFLEGVITQNVDSLHQAAGSSRVVELHGALARVRCLQCGENVCRNALQRRIAADEDLPEGATLAPDGDADVARAHGGLRCVPTCLSCTGALKPDVVFFGENVPRDVVDDAWNLMADAEVLLVAGSSLAVYSGYRFVKWASERRMPIAIVNRGETRGDQHAWLKVDGNVADVMPALFETMQNARPRSSGRS